MLTWCSRAVRFRFSSFRAASARSSPLGPLPRFCARCGLGSGVFSSVRGLSSTTSAGDPSLLFGCFAGTTPLYGSPPLCMRVLSLIAFSLRPLAFRLGAAPGPLGSRAWSFSACPGSSTPRETQCACAYAHLVVVFRTGRHHRLPATQDFGARGSLLLLCTTLSFATPRRFIPTLSGHDMAAPHFSTLPRRACLRPASALRLDTTSPRSSRSLPGTTERPHSYQTRGAIENAFDRPALCCGGAGLLIRPSRNCDGRARSGRRPTAVGKLARRKL